MTSRDEKIRMLASLVPVRAPVKEERHGGRVTLVYPKNFTRFERWLHRYIGGPTEIRRPLDEMATTVWDLCDGDHTVAEIIEIMDMRYKEKIEPAGTRVTMFLENLLRTGLITMRKEKTGKGDED